MAHNRDAEGSSQQYEEILQEQEDAQNEDAATPVALDPFLDYMSSSDLGEAGCHLPEPDNYTVVRASEGFLLLFLGEVPATKTQAWAVIRQFRKKQETVEYVSVTAGTGAFSFELDPNVLPINMYPFSQALGATNSHARGRISALVRFVMTAAGHINGSISEKVMSSFRHALNNIHLAIQAAGDTTDALQSTLTRPSKLPRGCVVVEPREPFRGIPANTTPKGSVRKERKAKAPEARISRNTSESRSTDRPDTSLPAFPAFIPSVAYFDYNGERIAGLTDDEKFMQYRELEAKRLEGIERETLMLAQLKNLRADQKAIREQQERLVGDKSITWLIEREREALAEEELEDAKMED